MLANGSDWSSLSRTTGQGCGPSGRRGCSFIACFLSKLFRAIADRHAAAGELDRFLGKLHIRHLLDGRLLRGVDVAVLDAVVDGPLRPLFGEAGVDRPDAVLGPDIDG